MVATSGWQVVPRETRFSTPEDYPVAIQPLRWVEVSHGEGGEHVAAGEVIGPVGGMDGDGRRYYIPQVVVTGCSSAGRIEGRSMGPYDVDDRAGHTSVPAR